MRRSVRHSVGTEFKEQRPGMCAARRPALRADPGSMQRSRGAATTAQHSTAQHSTAQHSGFPYPKGVALPGGGQRGQGRGLEGGKGGAQLGARRRRRHLLHGGASGAQRAGQLPRQLPLRLRLAWWRLCAAPALSAEAAASAGCPSQPAGLPLQGRQPGRSRGLRVRPPRVPASRRHPSCFQPHAGLLLRLSLAGVLPSVSLAGALGACRQ